MGHPGRTFIVIFGCIAAMWIIGLVLFVTHIRGLDEPPPVSGLSTTDAIVVLTGGSERIGAGLDLLRAGKGKKLFISGVHPGLSLDHLLANQQIDKTLRDCCIILGHEAESTLGNAEETFTWMGLENYHSLRLVTANYHMPRSLMVFHAMMPEVEIIPHPVIPDKVMLQDWWMRSGTASLLITEYSKYLWANIRQLLGSA